MYKNCWPPFNRIFSIYVNNKRVITDVIQCQPTVPVQIICKLVPMTPPIFVLIHRNIVRFGIHILKIGKSIANTNSWENSDKFIWKVKADMNWSLKVDFQLFGNRDWFRAIKLAICSFTWKAVGSIKSKAFMIYYKIKCSINVDDGCEYSRDVSTNQSSASTVVSGGSSASQHQHQIMPATSPLSQFTTNGEVQKLRTTTPPHNLSNQQTQQRGKSFQPFTFSFINCFF